MATTPPPPSFLRIPPTPRHGTAYDQYEPYSTRHSARLASQRASTESRTTPPPSFPISQRPGTSRTTKKQRTAETEIPSPPGSPNCRSPREMMPDQDRTATQALDNSTFLSTAGPAHARPSCHSKATTTEGMLPTPAKTPRKKPVDNGGSAARALFPTSHGQKKRKKQTGFSLDSFTDDPPQGESIQIYTDSRDRIPEVDESEANPFYKKPSPKPNARPITRKTGGRDKEVDEALKREDGMVYVFRGKKMFRKFSDGAGSDVEDYDDDLGLLASRPDLIDPSLLGNTRPLTRSSIKPRVLFPSPSGHTTQENQAVDADEEAATDIEDHVLDEGDSAQDLGLAVDNGSQQRLATPPPNSVATPPSPGTCGRSLRPRAKREGLEHGQTASVSEGKRKRISPFDGWLRKKQTPPVIGSKAKKRDAESAGSPGGPAFKRTRGNRTSAPTS
ncbi:uncharacterized protein BJX67DRAFT_53384 [Aspergillus lucknowensis]|uniref:Uncharacterized protein n=1 Tax=Aspergillus lucknowensis TaxID=176173 RepID=A0ABR4LV90_9EURO